MASYYCEEEYVYALPVWIIGYVVNNPPRVMMYYCGSVVGWRSDWRDGCRFFSREGAELVRDSLGYGRVIRVYDRESGLSPAAA